MMQLRLIDWALATCLGLLPLVATFAHKGTVILLVFAGIVSIISAISKGSLAAVFPVKIRIFMLCGLGWLVVASLIATNAADGLLKSAQICALGILFVAVSHELFHASAPAKELALRALTTGSLLSLALLTGGYCAIGVFEQNIYEIERGNKLSVLLPGFIVMALLFPGASGYLQRTKRIRLSWFAFVTALGLSVAIGSFVSTVLFVIVGLSHVLFRRDPWVLPKILAIGLVVVTVTVPVSMPLVLDRVAVMFVQDDNSADLANEADIIGSIEHRYHIWRFAADRAAERPFFGWGFNTSRTLPGGHDQYMEGAELLPLHPHNAVLQVWLELGVPGLVLLCILLWRTYMPPSWHEFNRRELFIRVQTVTVIFIAASATFGIWQSWWLAAIALVMASTSLWHERDTS